MTSAVYPTLVLDGEPLRLQSLMKIGRGLPPIGAAAPLYGNVTVLAHALRR